MALHNNENGGTLSLVLLISMILSIIVVSLIALFGQTNLVTAQAGTQERAYADADSVIRMMKRSMREVVKQSNGISAEGVSVLIDELMDQELPAMNRLDDNLLDLQLIGTSKVRAEAEHGHGKFKRKQVIELSFTPLPATDDDLATGGGGNGFGEGAGGTSHVDLDDPIIPILNHPVVTPLRPDWDYQNVEVLFNVCSDELDPIGSLDESVMLPPDVTEQYNQIYASFVERMIASGPAPIVADTSGLPLFTNSDYTSTDPDPQAGFGRNGSLNFRGGPNIVIHGDVMVTGNVLFNSYGTNDYNIVIHGDLIVGGNISMYNTIPNLTVTGTVSAGGNITFQQVHNLTIGGSLIAGGRIELSGHGIQHFSVGNDMRANEFVQNAVAKHIDVGGTVYITNSFTMNHSSQMIDSLTIGGSLYAGNAITLNASVKNIRIKGDMMTNGNITINHSVGSNTVVEFTYFTVGGAFGALNNMFVGDSIFTKTSFGGYYIGHETILNNKVIGYNNQGFCINHQSPGSGGGGGFDFDFGDIVTN